MKNSISFLNIIERHNQNHDAIKYQKIVYTYADLTKRAKYWEKLLEPITVIGSIVICQYEDNPFEYTAKFLAIMNVGGVHYSSRDIKNTITRLEAIGLTYAVLGDIKPSGLESQFCLYSIDQDGKLLSQLKPTSLNLYLPTAGRILETSGSTGLPKLVYWHEQDLVQDRITWCNQLSLTDSDIILNLHPLDFAHGIDVHILSGIISGCSVIHLPLHDNNYSNISQIIKSTKITMMSALPSHYVGIANASESSSVGRTVRWALTGGALLSGSSVKQIQQLSGINLKRLYGATEAGVMCADLSDTTQLEPHLHPMTGVEIRLESLVGISNQYPNIGEACFKRAHLASGYVGDIEKTAKIFSIDGWYRSGDAVRQNPDNSFEVLGRIEDIWIDNETNALFYSGSIIDTIIAFDEVLEVVAIAPAQTKSKHAVIFCRVSTFTTIQSVKDLVQNYIDHIQLIATIYILNDWPSTIVGKPDRRSLLTWAATT
jgi:acyl-coenzyme A synthetase/AMP-(fatty) acid ligase